MKEEFDSVSDIKKGISMKSRKDREQFMANYKRGIYKEMHRRNYITEEQLERLLEKYDG